MKGHRIGACFVVACLLCALRLSAQQAAGTPAAVSESPSAANAFAQANQASLPRLVKFSGTVKETVGRPVMGITFALYKDQEGGAALWLETQNVPLEEGGRYSVFLGATREEGLPMELFASGEARWLGVQPEGQIEQPRVLLVSVPYALKAGDAQTLGGLPPSAFAPANFSASANAPFPLSASGVLLATTGGQPEAATNAGTAALTGGGTASFIPLWTNSTTLGNSILFQSTTSNVNVNGSLSLPALKTATSTSGTNSQPLDLVSSVFRSSTHAAVSQHFRWQAEPVGNNTTSPSGKLNLLFASGTGSPAETGLSISNKGLITFASGQTLPAITGNETVTGNVSANQLQSNVATGTAPFVVKSTTQVANLNASFLGGMPASSFATHGSNSFLGTQIILGSGPGVFLGDPGCGSQYSGVAFGPFFGCTNYSLVGDGVNTFIGSPPNGTMYFIGLSETGGGATDMQINPDGKVGIGTATPFAQLHVKAASGEGLRGAGGNSSGTASAGSGIVAEGGTSSGNGTGGAGIEAIAGSANTNGINGGIGVVTAGGNSVSGGGGLGGFGIEAFGGRNGDGSLARAGEFHGDVEITGCLGVNGTPNIGNCQSDARLKKNIRPYSPVLDKLVRLQPVTYNWRTEKYPQYRFGTEKSSGLIAQEVEKVFPEMVSVDAGGFRRVNYGGLPLLMLQAIRELKTENDNLQEQLKARNQDRDDVRSELAQLRAEVVERLAAMVKTANGATVQASVSASHR